MRTPSPCIFHRIPTAKTLHNIGHDIGRFASSVILALIGILALAGNARAQWPNGYQYSGTITVSHSNVPNTDQLNFPVLVSGTYSALATTANGGQVTNANGFDIIFTSDSAGLNKLNFERESYSPTNGAVSFWVQIPDLSHTTDTVFYIFYSNPSVSTDQSNPGATWDSNYLGVWHLGSNLTGQNPMEMDSTSNGNNLTPVGTYTASNVVPSKIGQGLSLSDNDGFTSSSPSLTPTTSMTASAWVQTTIGNGIPSILAQYNFINNSAGYYFIVDADGDPSGQPGGHLRFKLSAGNNGGTIQTTFDELTTNITDGNWHYIVATYASGAIPNLYVDGTQVPAPPTNGGYTLYNGEFVGSLANPHPFLLVPGNNPGDDEPYPFYGQLDEARLSGSARSSDWIATEYTNQNNPAAFYGVVWGQTYSGSPVIIPSPSSLAFSSTSGQANPAPQSTQIAVSGRGSWTATANQSWITVSTAQNGAYGSSASSSSAPLWVAVASNGAGLVTGLNTGTITLTASGATPQIVTVSFNLAAGGATWGNGYTYQGTITISHTQVPNTTQTNFPVLISGTYPALATIPNGGQVTSSNGYDIIFTSDPSGLNSLNYERASYSPTTGQVMFWVQVPSLSPTTDTVFYIFYGNSSVTTDQSNSAGTWNNAYGGVWHLANGTTLSATDSTANHLNGTISGATAATGFIDGGANFNGTSSYINFGNNLSAIEPSTSVTVSAWVNPNNSTQNNYANIVDYDYSTPRGFPYVAYKLSPNNPNSVSNKYEFELSTTGSGDHAVSSTTTPSGGTWAYVVGTYDGATQKIYVNGVLQGQASLSGNIQYSNGNFVFGANGSFSQELWNGITDEVHVSQTARSADWITTEYNNQNNPTMFYSVILGQTSSGSTPIITPSPSGVSFSAASGGANPSAQSVGISVSNSGSWTATANQSWITVATSQNGSYGSSATSSGTALWIQVATNGAGLISGLNSGSITISSTGATSQPVNVSFTISTPTITPSPSNVSFSATGGGANPAAQSTGITVSNGGSWTATANQSWITVATSQGGSYGSSATSSGTALWIEVATDGAGLNTGLNSGSITISSTGATSQPVSISFTISAPTITPSPSGVSFSATSGGGNPAAQSTGITVSNGGSWTATANQSWITVATSQGGSYGSSATSSGTALWIEVATNGAGLNTGLNSGSITISSAGATSQPVSVSFTITSSGGGGTFSNGYSYQGAITVHHAQVPNTTQTNFPVLISGTYPALATTANGGQVTNANGYDIIFTSDAAGLNPLNYEREQYSPTTGQAAFWVQVPSLSSTTDTVFYVFYGNAAVTTDQSNKTETWDSNYGGVWHLPNGTTLSANDSTANGVNGTISGATAATGLIDGGANFNGTSSYITFGSGKAADEPATAVTVSAWVKPNSGTQNNYANIIDYDYATPRGFPYVSYKLSPNNPNGVSNRYEFELSTTGSGDNAVFSSTTPAAGTWAYVVGTYDGATQKIYVNGVLQGQASLSGNIQYSNGNFVLGANGSLNQELWNGVTDEVRVSKMARTADWITTEYNNQNSPASFYSATWGQTSSGGSTPTITPSPSGVSFSATSGGGNPATQSTSITVSNGGSWTATANQSWITVATSQGGSYGSSATSSGTALWIQVATNGAGLSSGLNSGSITISSAGATSEPVSISFTISAPTITPSPSGVSFSATSGGGNPAAQSTGITVSNGGSWTATANQSWITVATSQGGSYGSSATSSGTALWIEVATNGAGLNTGLNSGSITISSAGATSQPVSVSFTITSSGGGGTFSNGYSYQGAITVHHAQVPNTTQTNFPVLISGTYPALATTANGGQVTNANGYDIIFTSDAAGLNPLNYEREQYSPTTGQAAFWVQVPSLSSTTDTVFYVFYGNAAVTTDQSNKTETWDSNYGGVWHLPNGTTLSANDSTANGVNGTISGATAATGLIDGGANFNGTSSYITFGSGKAADEPATAVTVSAWVKPNSGTQNNYANIIDYDYATPRGFPYVSYKLSPNNPNGVSNRYEFELSTTGSGDNAVFSSTTPAAGTWAYVVGTYDGATQKIYVNGVLQGQASLSGNIQYSNGNFVLGANGSLNQELWNGVTDEVRVSKMARTADWITTEYNNQNSPASFYSATWGQTP